MLRLTKANHQVVLSAPRNKLAPIDAGPEELTACGGSHFRPGTPANQQFAVLVGQAFRLPVGSAIGASHPQSVVMLQDRLSRAPLPPAIVRN